MDRGTIKYHLEKEACVSVQWSERQRVGDINYFLCFMFVHKHMDNFC
jgi:hypothetical protein